MDFGTISKWKVQELKTFLHLRGLNVSGRKEEFIARVFVAYENNVLLIKSAEDVQQEIALEYCTKLIIEGENLPDPFQSQDGWRKEEDGVCLWPTALYPDIFNFPSFNPSELKNEDLSDYKTSKVYSYYATGWLNPLAYQMTVNSVF